MKSMEDLNLMTVPMLENIHLQLTGNKPKKGLTKQQLVLSVFDLQQADPTPPETPEAPKSGDGDTPPAENNAAGANDFDDLTGDVGDADADALSVNDDEDLIGEAAPQAPERWEAPHSNEEARFEDIERALRHLPLRIVPDETGITLHKGSKSIYATIRQPLHVIVATAEAFAGVR